MPTAFKQFPTCQGEIRAAWPAGRVLASQHGDGRLKGTVVLQRVVVTNSTGERVRNAA